jgi:rhamnose transport system ATP-binding protein
VNAPFLQVHGLDKRFGAVQALDGAHLEVNRGEIHGLVGENGSGKTTMMRILAGDIMPDAGEVRIGGEQLAFGDPRLSRSLSIGVVYQEPNLGPDLTIAENVFMGRLPKRRGRVDSQELRDQTLALSAETGIRLEPDHYIRDLSPDQRQMVEIAKVVAASPSLMAFDEPTAALTSDQVETLFNLLRRLRDAGRAIIMITHRLQEVFTLADRATILRDGLTRSTLEVADTDEDEIVRLMVGRELKKAHRTATEVGEVRLDVQSLNRGSVLRDVSLSARSGEIVGLSGLVGAGRSALFRTLFGLRRFESGSVSIDGRAVELSSPRDAIRAGMGLVPEDRRQAGLCMDMSLAENIALGTYAAQSLVSMINLREIRAEATRQIRDIGIQTPGTESPVGTLSGGNQQKVVLARWLALEPRLLLLDEPTRGIDVGAKAEIYELLDQLAKRGVCLLVSSSELPELLTLCDRIYAMYRGRIVAEFTRQDATEEKLARAIASIGMQVA